MSALADLPSLGGPPGLKSRGMGGFGGFGADAAEPVEDESNDGFDDFDMNEDAFGDSSNKFDNAEKHLNDFYREENEGFKISSSKEKSKNKAKQANKAGFKVNIQGMDRQDSLHDDDFDEEIIEEDIQTDRDEQANLANPGAGMAGNQYGITISGSLGIDPSVDSLAIEDYDYVEIVNP